ncbi:acyl carrier protein [Paraburkholderia jirisanensis]
MNTMKSVTTASTTIQTWLVKYLADLLQLQETEVNLDRKFARFGLDSASIAAMAGELTDWLGVEVDPLLLYSHSTIRLLGEHLGNGMQLGTARQATA